MSFGNLITTTAASISSGGTINGNLTIEGDLTVNGDGAGAYDEIVNGNFVIGSDGSGHDVIFYSGTAGDNFTWDASEECLIITGTDAAQALKVADGDLVVVDKIYLYDNDGGEYLHGSSDGHLEINAGTTLDITAPTVDLNSATEFNIDTAAYDLNASGAVTIDGAAISIDGTDDCNFNINGSGKILQFYVQGGGANQVQLVSAGTGSDAIELESQNGGVTVGLGGGAGDDFIVNSTTLVVESDNSRVGIGTASPNVTLDVSGAFGVSGAASLASSSGVTTIGSSNGLTVSAAGVLTVNSATDASSSTSGSTIIDGGVGIAKKLYVGTDLDVDGTTNLDAVDIDGAVDMASTLQVDGAITSSTGATITTADNTDTLSLVSTDDDANAGPNLRLYRNAANPASDDVLGRVDFEGRNNNSQDVVYGSIQGEIMSTTDGSETGQMQFGVMVAGTLRNLLMIDRTEVAINEDTVDVNFRVESDGNANMLFVDGGNNRVGIGTAAPSTLTHIEAGTLYLNSAQSDTVLSTSIAGTATHNIIGSDGYWGMRTAATGNTFCFDVYNGGSPAMAFAITNDALVGIGTTTPISSFEVEAGLTTTGAILTLGTKEPTVVANDVLGRINFYAPLETGTDAIAVAASIVAVAEDTFAATVNSTSLQFQTGKSEVATTKMTIDEDGKVGIGKAPAVHLDILSTDTTELRLEETSGSQLGMYAGGSGSFIRTRNSTTLGLGTSNAVRMLLDDNSRISLSNNDGNSYNTVFGKNAFEPTSDGDVGADYNVAIGEDAMGTGNLAATTQNVAVGYKSLEDITAGDNNVGVGSFALAGITEGSNNVAIGQAAGEAITTANKTVFIGAAAGDAVTTTGGSNVSDGTVGIGYQSLTALTSGARNLAIGYLASQDMTDADDNVMIGWNAALDANDTGFLKNTGVGNYVFSQAAGVDAEGNTAVGFGAIAGVITDTAHENTAIGFKALNDSTSGDDNVCIGSQSGLKITAGSDNVVIGTNAVDVATLPDGCIFVGQDAGGNLRAGIAFTGVTAIGTQAVLGGGTETTGINYTTAVGYRALEGIVSGANNTAVGVKAGLVISTGHSNTLVGSGAGDGLTTSNYNTAVGLDALGAATLNADQNTAIGRAAMSGAIVAEYVHDCVAIGDAALAGSLDSTNGVDEASGSVAVGKSALGALTTGHGCIGIGLEAAGANATGSRNMAIGYNALKAHATSGQDNLAIGYNAMVAANDAGFDYNTAIGNYSMDGAGAVACAYNTAVGYGTLGGTLTAAADSNTAVGYESLMTITSGANNSAVGAGSGDALSSGSGNVAIGTNALGVHTTGGDNTAIGYLAMSDTDHGDCPTSIDNVFVGKSAGGGTWATNDSNANVGIGNYSLDAVMNGALRNSALGMYSLSAITTGQDNVGIGSSAGLVITTGIENTCIGQSAGAVANTGNYNTFIGSYSGATCTDGIRNTTLGRSASVGATDAENQTAIGYNCTAVDVNHTVTIGGAEVTAVYMAQDSGARMYSAGFEIVVASGDASTIENNGTGKGLKIQQDGEGTALWIDTAATTGGHGIYFDAPLLTTGHCIAVADADSLTTGSIINAHSGANNTDARSLVKIHNDHVSDTNTTPLKVINDANSTCVEVKGTFATMGNNLMFLNASGRSSSNGFDFFHTQTGADGPADSQHLLLGDGTSKQDGGTAWTAGADYAEYFETVDGNAIGAGVTVKLVDDKVQACESDDTPIGVVRPIGASACVGNTAWNRWINKYLVDDYGVSVQEEYTITQWIDGKNADGGNNDIQYHTDKIPEGVTVPEDATVISVEGDGRLKGQKLKRRKLNPDFDESKTYVSRDDREEWVIVGLLGQIQINKGQPTGNWIKMKDVSDTVEMYFVK
jgi:hypothetical protein